MVDLCRRRKTAETGERGANTSSSLTFLSGLQALSEARRQDFNFEWARVILDGPLNRKKLKTNIDRVGKDSCLTRLCLYIHHAAHALPVLTEQKEHRSRMERAGIILGT